MQNSWHLGRVVAAGFFRFSVLSATEAERCQVGYTTRSNFPPTLSGSVHKAADKCRNKNKHQCNSPESSFGQRTASGNSRRNPEQSHHGQRESRHHQKRHQSVMRAVQVKEGVLPDWWGQNASQKPAKYGTAQSSHCPEDTQHERCH